jgi:hypothetical protein
MTKWWEKSVIEALNGLELGGLPGGKDLVLGLADNYAVALEGESHGVSEAVWSKVIRLCSDIRRHTLADAP